MEGPSQAGPPAAPKRLEPSATGTRFTQISEFEWKRLPRILHGTFERGVRRDIRGQLRALKQLLET